MKINKAQSRFFSSNRSRRRWQSAALCATVLHPMMLLAAQPTLQDISKSFDSKLSQSPDTGHLTAIVIGFISVVCILVIASQWGRRRETPKILNHPGRLLREIRRKIHLTNPQIKRLKILADRKGCSSPLTLLLCPSLLANSPTPREKPPPAASHPPAGP